MSLDMEWASKQLDKMNMTQAKEFVGKLVVNTGANVNELQKLIETKQHLMVEFYNEVIKKKVDEKRKN